MKQANIIDRFRLDGKVALVTGGSGYYGKQMVIALADAGATVCCASRGVDKCREFTDSLNAAGYDKVYADQYDQADEASIHALLERMTARDGKVDILVNNSVLRPMHDYEGPAADLQIHGGKCNRTVSNFPCVWKSNGEKRRRKHYQYRFLYGNLRIKPVSV